MAIDLPLPQCGVGVFSEREKAETALQALQNAGFSLDQVSVVVRDPNPDDPLTESENEFIREKTVSGLTKGALSVGVLGSLGGLLAGLSTLVIPGIGPVALAGAKVALAGMFAGGYYGTAAGGIIGAAVGNGISKEHAEQYNDRLAAGDYLIMVDGSKETLQEAEPVLKSQGIQDWGIYSTT